MCFGRASAFNKLQSKKEAEKKRKKKRKKRGKKEEKKKKKGKVESHRMRVEINHRSRHLRCGRREDSKLF